MKQKYNKTLQHILFTCSNIQCLTFNFTSCHLLIQCCFGFQSLPKTNAKRSNILSLTSHNIIQLIFFFQFLRLCFINIEPFQVRTIEVKQKNKPIGTKKQLKIF